MNISYRTGLAALAAALFMSGAVAPASAARGSGNDVLLGERGNDVHPGQGGRDLLIINNGDGSDIRPGARGPNRLTARRGTDLEWRGMFVNPVGGWKGSGAGSWVFQGATLKIRDIIVRKSGKIPGDTRKVQIVNRLVRLSPPPRRTAIHSWISNILQKPGGPQGDIHDFNYKIPMNVKPGKYRICMVIDPRNRIKETDETNNRYCYGPFWIRPRPHH